MNQVSATIAFGPGAEAGVCRALYWASVSNPPSPFVDMVSGAQGTAADTSASKIALVGLHLVAAAIIVPVLARHAD